LLQVDEGEGMNFLFVKKIYCVYKKILFWSGYFDSIGFVFHALAGKIRMIRVFYKIIQELKFFYGGTGP
jgi:hypothetical protein